MNNDLADSATALPEWKGLSPKGRDLVQRANRLGILLDVSHASDAVFDQMLTLSSAPLIASHSSSRAVNPHPRNLDDARVRQLAAKGGVIQVNAYSDYLIPLAPNPDRNKAMAALGARFHNLAALSPQQVKALYQERDSLNQRFAQPKANIWSGNLLRVLQAAQAKAAIGGQATMPVSQGIL
jgi:membrane dipeptidase